MLDIIGSFSEKNKLSGGGVLRISANFEQLWHPLGSKSYLIIGQKTQQKKARLYRRVLRKNRIGSGGGGVEYLWHFWDQNHT